jgi:ABC-2 type transport system permease protein
MSVPPNPVPATPLDSQPIVAPVAMAPTRPFYWSVRREFWENSSLYIAPLAAAGIYLVGFLISLIGLPNKMRSLSTLDPVQQLELIQQPYNFVELLLMATFLIVAIFYCLDALYGERRDRSILFWKSLPISDLTTVLAKASIPVLILPLVTFAITVVTQWIMVLLSAVALLGSGQSVAMLWNHLPLFHMWLGLLDHLFGFHGLWYAPFYCWLLLVSAWARRAPFMWAALPPLVIGIVEKIAFNTSHFTGLLLYRFTGGPEGAAYAVGGMSMDPLTHLNPAHLLLSPGLWTGFAVSAVFLALAVRLRRYRDPI